MLSTMSFCPAVESAACSMSSDFLGGVVNTQGFVWKFVCVIYKFLFIHSFVSRPKSRRKHVAEFDSVFYFGEGIASGKHESHAVTHQHRLVKRSTERGSNKMVRSSIPMRLLFLRMILLHKFQTHCGSGREKQFILAAEA